MINAVVATGGNREENGERRGREDGGACAYPLGPIVRGDIIEVRNCATGEEVSPARRIIVVPEMVVEEFLYEKAY